MSSRVDVYTFARLYLEATLSEGASLPLSEAQFHYFKTVLRKQSGDSVRVFHPQEGEFLAQLTLQKKEGHLTLLQRLRPPVLTSSARRHLYFALPKKKAFDLALEKAVELGVTDFHPLTTQHVQVRTLDPDRIRAQIIEAAEQSERLDLPTLHPLTSLATLLDLGFQGVPLFAAVELVDAPLLGTVLHPADITGPLGFLVGPEGGFSKEERALLSAHKDIRPVSLGDEILKVETAIFFGLSAFKLLGQRAFLAPQITLDS